MKLIAIGGILLVQTFPSEFRSNFCAALGAVMAEATLVAVLA